MYILWEATQGTMSVGVATIFGLEGSLKSKE